VLHCCKCPLPTPTTADDDETFLGIDLGTTTVKLCVLNARKEVLQEFSAPTTAPLPQHELPNPKWHEQNISLIVKCVSGLLRQFEPRLLGGLKSIAVAGQMHGVVLWEAASIDPGSPEKWNCSD